MKEILIYFSLLFLPSLLFASPQDELDCRCKDRLSQIVQDVFNQCNPNHFGINEQGYYPVDIILGSNNSSHYGNKLLRKVVQKSLYTFILQSNKQHLIAKHLFAELTEYGVEILRFDGSIWKAVPDEEAVKRILKSFNLAANNL
ncbi:MAG: hypothetical protein AB8G05_20020 [Oligoflexales bacterium]